MNVLFLTMSRGNDLNARGIYSDLMRRFIKDGHHIYMVCPSERRFKQPTTVIDGDGYTELKVWTLNLQKTNAIEKGIGQLLLEWQYGCAIRQHFNGVKFDLVLYSTPPITFNRVIEKIKQRDGAATYLMLKDIFPQNAVDLGMLSTKSPIYKLFRKKERRLYQLSDRIGCMSPANRRYVLEHNPEVAPNKVELCPNAVELTPVTVVDAATKQCLFEKYDIPTAKTIFIYGGNLGKPQGVDFLMKVVEANESRSESFILIVGSGTEYNRISQWFEHQSPKNARLLSALPRNEYDQLITIADVGMIFLDPRFTIPNFPSRLLVYLENHMPVLLATDRNTDMGTIAEENGFGLWCESGDTARFMANLDRLCADRTLRVDMGERGYRHLCENYTIDHAYRAIMRSVTR